MIRKQLIKPVLHPIGVLNAEEKNRITFAISGNFQTIANEVEITDLSTNIVVYKETLHTYSAEHIIDADELNNGTNYSIKVRVKTNAQEWTNFSEPVFFWCYSNPVITIPTIEHGKVYSQTVEFVGNYTQKEGDDIMSYRFVLYNENRAVIETFSEKFPTNEDDITQEVAGLENEKGYYLELVVKTQSGNKGTSGKVFFKPVYIEPTLNATIALSNEYKEGGLKVDSIIKQIILEVIDMDGNPVSHDMLPFVDNQKLDLNADNIIKLHSVDGLNTKSSDFMLSLWVENLKDGGTLLEFTQGHKKIKLKVFKNRIYGYKYSKIELMNSSTYIPSVVDEFLPEVPFSQEWRDINTNNITSYQSNEFDITKPVYIELKQKHQKLDIFVKELEV